MLQKTNTFLTPAPEWELENQLFRTLNPVNPDPLFVNRLEERLKTRSVIVLERESLLGAYLVIASGLFGGALLLWLLHVVFSGIKHLTDS